MHKSPVTRLTTAIRAGGVREFKHLLRDLSSHRSDTPGVVGQAALRASVAQADTDFARSPWEAAGLSKMASLGGSRLPLPVPAKAVRRCYTMTHSCSTGITSFTSNSPSNTGNRQAVGGSGRSV